MLEKFGINVPREQMRTRNAAAVMVTAPFPSFGRKGTRFDVTVSSLGDATSLEGGVLLMTPLMDESGLTYGMAQGPVSLGGFNIETEAGEKLRKNHAQVGRVPAGGYLTFSPQNNGIALDKPINLHLQEADFITARRIADKINEFAADGFEGYEAHAVSPGIVEINMPDSLLSQEPAISFIAGIETLKVKADMEARVVINERTGTIVAGGMVTIDEVMISHGNLTIHTRQRPIISQPQAFSSQGQTVVAPVTETTAYENEARTAVVKQTTSVSELAAALNELGLKPRDIISIFQAIEQAGALRAKLVIL